MFISMKYALAFTTYCTVYTLQCVYLTIIFEKSDISVKNLYPILGIAFEYIALNISFSDSLIV
jgi:hypothetical protein